MKPLPSPQWLYKEAGNVSYPAAYVRKGLPQVVAAISITGPSLVGKKQLFFRMVVEGKGYSAVSDAKAVTPTGGDKYSVVLSPKQRLPDMVGDFQMSIDWQVSVDGRNNWSSVGKSENKVYVLYGRYAGKIGPGVGNRNPAPYETLIALGSYGDLAAVKTDADMLARVWSRFTDRTVTDVRGNALAYYGSWPTDGTGFETDFTSAANLEGLLQTNSGQCGAFGKLFFDALRFQGLSSTNSVVRATLDVITPTANSNQVTTGFLVGPSAWTFTPANQATWTAAVTSTIAIGQNVYPGVLKTGNAYSYQFAPNSPIAYTGVTTNGSPALIGQNNTNPFATFTNHVVVKVTVLGKTNTTLYYDPSYGVTYKDLKDMQAKAIAGFYKTDYLRANNSLVVTKPDPTIQQLKDIIILK